MPFEKVYLFGILEYDYDAPAGATARVWTDLPGNALALRETWALPASTTRRTVKFRFKGTTKGKKYQAVVSSGGMVKLFGGRIYARPFGPSDAQWAWYALPIPATADEFSTVKLPIPKTSEEFTEIKLPIPKTAEEFSQVKLPMHPTPELLDWVDVPVAK